MAKGQNLRLGFFWPLSSSLPIASTELQQCFFLSKHSHVTVVQIGLFLGNKPQQLALETSEYVAKRLGRLSLLVSHDSVIAVEELQASSSHGLKPQNIQNS